MTPAEFMAKLNNKNAGRPKEDTPTILDPTEYKLSTSMMTCRCAAGHEYTVRASWLLDPRSKSGCKQCQLMASTAAISTPVDEAEAQLKEFASKLDVAITFDMSTYTGMSQPVTGTCELHGEFSIPVNRILKSTHGCPTCGRQSNRMTQEQFLERARAIHGSVYEYGEIQFGNSRGGLVEVTCKSHGKFTRSTSYVLSGRGCPACARTKSYIAETWLRWIELSKGITLTREYRIPRTRYAVDGYCESTNTVYEFHGQWHHGKLDGNEELLEKTRRRTAELRSKGYTVVEMWEFDWKEQADRLGIDLVEKIADVKVEGLPGAITHPVPVEEAAEYGLRLKGDTFHGFKHKHDWECLICGGDYNVSLTAKKMQYRKHKQPGCAKCSGAAVRLRTRSRRDVIQLNGGTVFPLAYLATMTRRAALDTILEARERGVVFYSDEYAANSRLIEAKLTHIRKESNLPAIFARKLQLVDVKSLDRKDVAQFFNDNHIQGNVANMPYGHALLDGDRIMACMTFSKPRAGIGNISKYTGDVYELVRYATDNNVRVVGGASRLLTAFERSAEPDMIYSFADKRWSDGEMYKKLGFELTTESAPDYFYVETANPVKRMHRWNYRKQAMAKMWSDFDPNLTELENAKAHGLARVWGLGQLKFVKNYS